MAVETIDTTERDTQLQQSLIDDIESLERPDVERLDPEEEFGSVDERLIRDIEGGDAEGAAPERVQLEDAQPLEQWYHENREVIREKDLEAAELAEEEIAMHNQEAAKVERLTGEFSADATSTKSPEVAKVEEEMSAEEARFEQRLKQIIGETYDVPKRAEQPAPEKLEPEQSAPVESEKIAPEQPLEKEVPNLERVSVNHFTGATAFSPSEQAASYLEEYQRLRKLDVFEGLHQTFTQPDGRSMQLEYDGHDQDPEHYLKAIRPMIERQLTVAEHFSASQEETIPGEDAMKSFESKLVDEYGREGVNIDRRLPDGQRIERWEPGIVTNIVDEDGVISISFEYDEQVAAQMQQYLEDLKRREEQ